MANFSNRNYHKIVKANIIKGNFLLLGNEMRNFIKIGLILVSTILLSACQAQKVPMYYGTYALSDTAKADKINVTITVGDYGDDRGKTLKVVKDGELLLDNVAESKVGWEVIQIFNPQTSVYFSNVKDNINYQRGGDMKKNYIFYDNYFKNDSYIQRYDKQP